MKVVALPKKVCDVFVRQKHYTRKSGIFWCGFGLIENGKITGVCVYGQPSPALQKHAFLNRDFRFFELSRVVVQSKTKNAASFLIGNSLQMLTPKPCAVVSYADTSHNHCGIIYQATNWLYTGATRSHDKLYMVNGELLHPMTLRDMGVTNPTAWAKENNIQTIPAKEKHRYFYIVGNKREKASILSRLRYDVLSTYPKCQKSLYDDGAHIDLSYEN